MNKVFCTIFPGLRIRSDIVTLDWLGIRLRTVNDQIFMDSISKIIFV